MARSPTSLVVSAAVAILAACAGAPKPPPPTLVAATVAAAADVNRDDKGRPSPIALRVYELGNRVGFESADFVSLFERDKQALGADLVSSEEWMLMPGESKVLNKKLGPEVRFIGVTAGYRSIEQARWRVIVPVKPQATNTLAIRAEALALTAAASAR